MENARFVPMRTRMNQSVQWRRLHVCAQSLGLAVLAGLFSGCETDGAGTPAASAQPMTPSANVKKVQAWKDAEMLAGREAGREALVGGGDSMKPIYGDNTMLVVTPINYADLQEGMTVVYTNRHGRRVAHQLLSPTRSGWRVQGLNNEAEDAELVTPENLIGVVYASLATEEP